MATGDPSRITRSVASVRSATDKGPSTVSLAHYAMTASMPCRARRMFWLFIILAASATARAAGEDAKALFDRATVQFRIGQFHDAAQTYQRVYELHPDPVLLYNCAQSFRLANEPDKALLFYRSFLSAKPDAPNREEVEGRIAELERVVAEQKKAKERPPNDVTPTPPAAPTQAQPPAPQPAPAPLAAVPAPAPKRGTGRSKKIAGIALLGVAAGAAVGGIVTAVLSGQASDSINAAAKSGQPFDPSKEAQGKTDTIVSGVMFGVAGAAAIAGGALLLLGVREGRLHERAVSLAPALSPTAVGATATVRF